MTDLSADFVIPAAAVRFEVEATGGLCMVRGGERVACGHVMPAFPLTRRTRMISVRDVEGDEIGLLDDVGRLDESSQVVIRQELEKSYFMPRIRNIIFAEEKLNVLTMEVETNRGLRAFQIRNVRNSIRKMAKGRIIIRDVDGNRYEIRDWTDLPGRAQTLLINYL